MKRVFYLQFIFLISFSCFVFAQESKKDFDDKDPLDKILRIEDRAGGTHNASNIGLFFENRGKLYPRRITQGPSGEFPINSTKHYIYRINQMVGVPGNVVQSRFTTNEEWEAAFGYNNTETARIAFSDDPDSWPQHLGWPVKDANGNDVILSDQDSYCVFNDSNNTANILGIQLAQTGYAYGSNFAKNILFFKYELTNHGPNDLTGVYFSLHNDIDVGNISGGTPEYSDDKIDFIKDKNLVYFFDDGVSSEWPGGKTGFFGIMMLQTPEVNGNQLGVTDMHYMLYDDDEISDKDSIQYGYMSSDPNLYNSSIGNKYFHIGNNTNIHYDDPATIPASGIDLLANISSGPYNLNRGDTLVFYTALVAGETHDELILAANTAQFAMDNNFDLAKPPNRPNLFSSDGEFKANLYWDDVAEQSFDKLSGYDFEGYRLYKSTDRGISWKRIADYDIRNNVGNNTGLQYSYTDTNLVNGIEYWYSITAYDKGDSSFESLESAIGNNLQAVNTVSVIPRSEAIGRTPISPDDVMNLNTGNSNYILNASSIDDEAIVGNEYKTTFSFVPRKEFGDLATQVRMEITDTAATKPYKYLIEFTSSSTFNLTNVTLDEVIREGYGYPSGGRTLLITGHGLRVIMSDSSGTPDGFRPQAGDVIAINFSMTTVRNNIDSVINKRSYQVGQIQTTTDGVSLQLVEPDIIKSVSRIGGTDNVEMTFEVSDASLVQEKIYIASIEGNGFINNSGFVLLSVTETDIQLDTLFSSDTFSFDGIEGKITFPFNTPPTTGNKFSVEIIKPVQPNIKDSYSFKIKGAKVDPQRVASELTKIRVVPNPYLVSSLYEPEFGELRREPLRQIQFVNLPPECTIYIFTVDADLIKTINHNATNGTETWDLRTEGGRELAAGMYIYVVKTKDSEFKERFAIIK
jgi:hypothetical protein